MRLVPTLSDYLSTVAELKNNFTWSVSRGRTFDYCARQYWWTYYGSWGGWSHDADPEARRAYMLKNLHTRWTWVGTVVHEAIEGILRQVQKGGSGDGLLFESADIDPNKEVERLTETMRRQWLESRDGDYRRRPKHKVGLAEHHYDEPLTRDDWAAVNAKAIRALQAFLRSPLFNEIRTSDTRMWLPIEKLDNFRFDGVDVWAVLDFASRTDGDGVNIYDWKTGAVTPDGNRAQLVCYTLYVEAAYGANPNHVTNHLVYLGDDCQVFPFQVTQDDIAETRDLMRTSIRAMKAKLANPDVNVARSDDFPMTDDLSKCAVCTFRELCGRQSSA